MQITLKQDELKEAVRSYISSMGIDSPVGEITFTATRSGGNGILTEVEVGGSPTTTEAKDSTNVTEITEKQEKAPEDTAPELPGDDEETDGSLFGGG